MSELNLQKRIQLRLLLLGLAMSLCVIAVSARLVYLAVVARDSLAVRGDLQHQHTLKLDPRRGTVRDRHGRELATSVDVESIYAVPKAFAGDRLELASRSLSQCLDMDAARVASRLRGGKSFVWLERKAGPAAMACVRALNLPGVAFLSESRRFYPKRSVASHLLGYVGLDNEGMSGVEYALEEEIRGQAGRRMIWTDARNRRAASRVDQRPVPGRSVFLTIDENLQYIAERELAVAIRESRAKSGMAILMRPETGELLAMASHPTFNPNHYGDYPESHWRNRAVTDVYEPGSTFKIVAGAAALEEGVTSEDERIDCGGGMIQVGDNVIRDHRVFDVLTFHEVIQYSSNVGMIRIGQRLGRERLERYVRAFGFGEVTQIELPAESRGILRPSEQWGPVTLASISFGQEIGVTPLQMVAAANVIATGGYLMRPRLVLGFASESGELDEKSPTAQPVRRVLTAETTARMKALLIDVVEHGTGRRARIPGYLVAGKTGTAQKAVRGGYSKTDYIASFVGFAPADRPTLTALVILDSPEGDHSGARAAAVFAGIVESALRYEDVHPEERNTMLVARRWPESPFFEPESDAPGMTRISDAVDGASKYPVAKQDVSAVGTGAPDFLLAPDVLGLPARDAVSRLLRRGIVPKIVGSGWVLEQEPAAGAPVESGTRARLVLGLRTSEPGRESGGPTSEPPGETGTAG